MVQVQLYAIVSDNHKLEEWIHPQKSKKLKGFTSKVITRIGNTASKIIRSMQIDGLWVYYFNQEGFLFLLASDGLERSARMQNYLRILTEIFYQNYDQRRFPTVLNILVTEINKIEKGQVSTEEQEGLINRYNLNSQKEQLNRLLQGREHRSQRAWLVTLILFVCILLLGLFYFIKK